MYSSQPFAVVENLVVDEKNRGDGIGQALLTEVEAILPGAELFEDHVVELGGVQLKPEAAGEAE